MIPQNNSTIKCSFYDPVVLERIAIVTGAGDSGYLAAIKEKVSDLFHGQRSVEAVRSIHDADVRIRSTVEEFYAKYVLPFNSPSDAELRIRLIVCANVQGQSAMWSTYNNTVRIVNLGVEAVGSGERWAVSTFPPLIRAVTGNERMASVLAVNAIRVAKIRGLDCGKETRLIAVNRFTGVPQIAVPSVVQELEGVLEEYEGYSSRLLQYISGLTVDGLDTNRDLGKLRDRVEEISSRLYPDYSVPDDFRLLNPRT